ncbi:MAG: ATP-binding cassette domain-containing protein, partial [Flavobacteriaceae bacterium]|nr:ATP-binding cassette domain-containing protein [Flavobacteriaceae bacterium]
MEKKPIIKIENLIKSFGTNNVLNGFSMELYKGEHLVIMGKSGSGKSVMIRCLVGLMVPDSGLIEIMGKNIENLN